MNVGNKNKVYIIAEAGVNHNGNLDMALDLVRVAKSCGADAVKFQTFKAEYNVSKHSKLADYQLNSGIESVNQLEMLKKLELSRQDFFKIKQRCDELKIDFISTPDDAWSVNLLKDLNVPYIKVASAEIDNLPFLKLIAQAGIAVILSTGMSSLEEVDSAVNTLREGGNKQLILLHCVSTYPAEIADVNLKAMLTLQENFRVDAGFSDHTIGSQAAIAAAALGAKFIEKHFTLNQALPGPDHKVSCNPYQLSAYISDIRNAELALGDGLKRIQKSEQNMRTALRRSLVTSRPLKKGEILSLEMVQFKRPGTGISPAFLSSILGKTLQCDIGEDELLHWEYLK